MFQRSPRALVFGLAALVVAIATTVMVATDLTTLHRRANSLGSEQSVFVARRLLPLGRTITAGDLRTRSVYRSQLPTGALKANAAAVGRVVTVPIVAGGFVADANLATRDRRGLDGALPAGTRAVRVALAGSIRPRAGAVVDLYATFPDPLSASADTEVSATVVAEGVTVLAAGTDRSTAGAPTLGVTLLVSPRQAQAITFAATRGTLTLVLAPPESASRN